jgi:phosphatidylserine/phosphatidylglycerophosphate/cardiolipin synthase-like enzyme
MMRLGMSVGFAIALWCCGFLLLCLVVLLAPLVSTPSTLDAPITHPLTATIQPQLYFPWLAAPAPARIVIAAAHIDSSISHEPDEAVLLWNRDQRSQLLAGWQLATRSRTATFPLTSTLALAPGQQLWCTAEAYTFRRTFGLAPACEWGGDSDPTVLDLIGKLTLPNSGGMIQLRNEHGQVVDTLLYGDEEQPADGWQGPAAQLYARGDIPRGGQVWHRKLDPTTDLPLDHDRATDWAGDVADLLWGRRVRLPGWQGWQRAELGVPLTGTATAQVTVLVGPEGLYLPMRDLLASATTSLDLSLYTLEHPELAQTIADTARRGVRVRLLLEGSPPGGISNLQRWCVAQIAGAGGDVRYAAAQSSAPTGYRPRYRFVHAKYLLVDDRLAANGTENFGYDSFPITTTVPMGGRRGYYLMTDAPPVVDALRRLFAIDWAPEHFLDLQPFDAAHPKYGGPPPEFVLPSPPAYPRTEAPFRVPTILTGVGNFAVISVPENALRPDRGLFALINRTGPGDEILLEQLYETKNWGDTTSNPIADPNPRLQALIEAARRGARVRLLLDQFFDDPDALRNNQATVTYVNDLAQAEGLDLAARLGNPTDGGIHAKLVLIHVGGIAWSAVGSLNGGETSHKLNREVVVLTDLPGVHTRLAEVFAWDWARSQ